MSEKPEYYLGLDLSTQQLKAVIVEAILDFSTGPPHFPRIKIVCKEEEHVAFDRLGYGTNSGALCKGPHEVVAPTRMWVDALDTILDRLRLKADFSRIVCIGGCAQQHGTVYWKDPSTLREMNPLKSLQENLKEAFSIENSPIWMDSSTTSECREMETAVGGAQVLAELTGSRAFERFSGPQIAKIANEKASEYNLTKRISLVSSFLSSLFVGNIAPIDVSDGSGMNLMDIRTNSWNHTCLRACFARSPPEVQYESAQILFNKLGGDAGLVPSGDDLGPVSNYMQRRFGFGLHCRVAAFTGDWERFNWLLNSTPPGNNGKVGVYFDFPEILPERQGRYRFDISGPESVAIKQPFAPEDEVRALVEGQLMSKRLYIERLQSTEKLRNNVSGKLVVTGGASANRTLCQIIADVFNMQVCTLDESVNSAVLGGVALAYHCVKGKSFEGRRLFHTESRIVKEPKNSGVYEKLLPKFKRCLECHDLL
ncbi:xylulose kinase-like isoform X2 [Varroa jacobsoni]|uniref:xylulose kinase-like isoform X2 n=1 Tax=Varroa jacobsoni TaxID=62625 RepID=UPI000BF462B0|nr:xylulose kinase-like isoform X2 [Varroa jacobsoni]